MVTIGLWFRILRGSGSRGYLRLVVAILGLAIAIGAGTMTVTIPYVLSAKDQIVQSRAPVFSDADSRAGLQISIGSEVVEQQVLTRVSVRNADRTSPRPPGVDEWPAPGESLVSPAVARLSGDSSVRHGLRVVGEVHSAGLTDPGELLIYQVQAAVPNIEGPSVVSFGGVGARLESHGSDALLYGEIALLVGIPCLLFVVTCVRVLELSREATNWGLYLIGMSPIRRRRMQLVERFVLVVSGGLIGVVLYSAVQGIIGRSGVLGIEWFPYQGSLRPEIVVLSFVLCFFLVYIPGRLGSRSEQHIHMRGSEDNPTFVAGLFGALSVIASLGTIGVGVFLLLHPPDGFTTGLVVQTMVLAGVLLICLPGAARWLIRAAASGYFRMARSAAGRLGASVALGQSRSIALLTALLSVIVMSGAVSGALLIGMRIDSLGSRDLVQASVSLDGLPSDQLHALSNVVPTPIIQVVEPRADGAVMIIAADCDAIRQMMSSRLISGHGCLDEMQGGNGADAADLIVKLRSGEQVILPAMGRDPRFAWDIKVPLSKNVWAWSAVGAIAKFGASDLDGSFAALIANIREAAPDAIVDAGAKDPGLWAVYLQQSALLSICLLVGAILTLSGALFTFVEARYRQRRSWVASVALGMPSSVIRRATAVTFGVPAFSCTALVGVIGYIVSLELLSAGWGGRAVGELWQSLLWWSLVPAIILTAFAALTGFLMPVPRFHRSIVQDY